MWCQTLERNKGDYSFKRFNFQEGSSQVSNAKGMCVFYMIQSIMSLIIAFGMWCFSKYLPTEISSKNLCIRLFGGVVRTLMRLQVFFHYVTLIQVILLWLGSLQSSCIYDADFGILDQGGELEIG